MHTWLCMFHHSHRLLCCWWDFLWKLLLFHTEMILTKYSFGEMCCVEESHEKMQNILILKILRTLSIQNQGVCLYILWSKQYNAPQKANFHYLLALFWLALYFMLIKACLAAKRLSCDPLFMEANVWRCLDRSRSLGMSPRIVSKYVKWLKVALLPNYYWV